MIIPLLLGVLGVGALSVMLIRQRHVSAEMAALRSELTQAQSALGDQQRSAQVRLAALDRIPMGLVIADSLGGIVYQNRTVRELASDARTRSLLDETVRDVLSVAAEQETAERELALVGPPALHILVTGRESPDGFVAVIQDISERHRVDAVRRDFVANLSHELKSPLGAMALLAETLVDEHTPDVRENLLRRINHEALRVGRLVDDLLDLSRLEADHTPHHTEVRIVGVVEAAVEQVLPLAKDRAIVVSVDSSVGGVTLLCDAQQLSRALVNLLENAVKYSDVGGLVEVSANIADMHMTVSVRDSGMGIPAEDLERIFERFYRVDRARSRATGGTGLGLAIVRHVMQNHGGEVLVSSHEGRGSTFSLQFPKPHPRTPGAP